eukprot:TRINITY_DN4360_c0_g1_i5.p1 TRINITY_DN4360_c0_g1~~TRINITY_DN4360_c0_g1_i5.p1  ORF type:complete len:194 (+),score=31.55 TRINITY_DN4360_c0_g1_i5:138-719(+)
MDLPSYLGQLQLDEEDDEELQMNYVILPEGQEEVKINEEDKLKPYLGRGFKDILKENLIKKNGNADKLTDRYAERMYRKLYNNRVRNNQRSDTALRFLSHPDITRPDYDFLTSTIKSLNHNYAIGIAVVFPILLLTHFRTPLGRKMRDNTLMSMVFYGLSPLATLSGTYYLNRVLLKQKITKAKLDRKYKVQL